MVMGDTSNYVKKVARNRLNIFRACHTHHTHLAHCGLKIMASAAVLDPTVLIVRGHRYDVTAYVDEHPGEGHNDDDWDGVDGAARLSSAGPAAAAKDVVSGGPVGAGAEEGRARINPEGYRWPSLVSLERGREMRNWWDGHNVVKTAYKQV